MNRFQTLLLTLAVSVYGINTPARDTGSNRVNPPEEPHMSGKILFEKLTGKWAGTCRTWFRPGEIGDESEVAGEITQILDGSFLRHTYRGEMQGKPRHGEELIAYNTITRRYQISWVDDFHMNYAIMFSEGQAVARGFSVRGEYDVGENQPRWGWRTEYELLDDDHLTVTAYNIHPEGMESRAVETVYTRVRE